MLRQRRKIGRLSLFGLFPGPDGTSRDTCLAPAGPSRTALVDVLERGAIAGVALDDYLADDEPTVSINSSRLAPDVHNEEEILLQHNFIHIQTQ